MWLVGLEPRPQRTRQRPVNHQANPLVMHLILQINFKECFGLKLWFACCMGSVLISVLLEAKILDVSLPLAMSIPSPIFIDLDKHLAALVGFPVAHGPSSRVHNSWQHSSCMDEHEWNMGLPKIELQERQLISIKVIKVEINLMKRLPLSFSCSWSFFLRGSELRHLSFFPKQATRGRFLLLEFSSQEFSVED
ncbi:hypothetical protein VNO77_27137 [Canavalia gladiata]|uniref:Uncharacterized protein n=1 Tax=Canavalia gladiata TaxID=3824 RepID=A0AAN9KU80_CANGL